MRGDRTYIISSSKSGADHDDLNETFTGGENVVESRVASDARARATRKELDASADSNRGSILYAFPREVLSPQRLESSASQQQGIV